MDNLSHSTPIRNPQSNPAALLDTDPFVDQLLHQFEYFVGLLSGQEAPPKPLTEDTKDRLAIELCRLSRQIALRLSKLGFVSEDDINRSVDAFNSVKELTLADQANPDVVQALKNIEGRAIDLTEEFGAKAH